ncbi:phosphotransferase enzyme family protein [Evansella clarkii]|uniref:phosphotransferase enzyme family protein n=1 Tax=Evansella clarkii TaxID=79879 RepID=UPI0014311E19|nr:phosphotransferase [Evansella clarkii]
MMKILNYEIDSFNEGTVELMKKEAKKYFTDEILHKGAELFSADKTSLTELAGFENFIYGVHNNINQEAILRFCHSSHRSGEQIEAELDWLRYLESEGAAVCAPLPSRNGRLMEEIKTDGTSFFVSMFEKARGQAVKIPENRNNLNLFFDWGKAVGELHRLTGKYKPSPSLPALREDYMEMSSKMFADFMPQEPDVRNKTYELISRISALPKTENVYGLTHTDLHSGNFFYDYSRLWIFDFDDCAYHYFIHDLAMPLYYSVWMFEGTTEERNTFSEQFLTEFLKGYLPENYLPLEEIEKISLFLKLRDCDLYGILHHEWEPEDLTEQRKKVLQNIRERIVNESPVVNLPYDKIYNHAMEERGKRMPSG